MVTPRPPSTASGRSARAKPPAGASTRKAPAKKPRAATKAPQKRPAKKGPAKKAAPATTASRKPIINTSAQSVLRGAANSNELVHVPVAEAELSSTDKDRLIRHGDVDEWGRSDHMRAAARAIFDPVYRRWFRVEWEGLEKIPSDGGALLVANHAGAVPSDAPVIMHGIESTLERPVYGLADNFFRKVPVLGTFWSRLGGLPAHPDNAYRLLRNQKQLVLVFPEGAKGPSKHVSQRYQLRRFGRGGFVEIAMRAGVPVIPIAVIGSEETMPIIAKLPGAARIAGVPYLPITANMLLMGPAGAIVPLPAKIKIRVLDPIYFNVEPDRDRYSRSRIMDESENIRDQIQQELYSMLRERTSIWRG